MNPYSDQKILDSWRKNAAQWTTAVRQGQIESRKLLTDQAIVETVLRHEPGSVLDIGCGEGWLVRALAPRVDRLVGLDAVPGLIEQARIAGGGEFHAVSYEEIARGAVSDAFDAVVCNFSLLGKESTDGLFTAVPSLLNAGGVFVVQTLHPVTACGESAYVDGWREGSWAGFGPDFTDPAPWYFRTIESWVSLFSSSGFRLLEMREPAHPATHVPASIVFVATMAAAR